DPRIRCSALLGLGRIGPAAAETLPRVRESLADRDAGIRDYAISAFWQISRDPEIVAPVAARMLADPNGGAREAAARTLEAIGLEATSPVIKMLTNDLAATRRRALFVLRRIMHEVYREEIAEALRT